MPEWGDGATEYALCMGAMTALAIITDQLCKAGALDRDQVVDELSAAQEMAADKWRIPLAMLQLLLELLEKSPSVVL
jgi:hypothetical protein